MRMHGVRFLLRLRRRRRRRERAATVASFVVTLALALARGAVRGRRWRRVDELVGLVILRGAANVVYVSCERKVRKQQRTRMTTVVGAEAVSEKPGSVGVAICLSFSYSVSRTTSSAPNGVNLVGSSSVSTTKSRITWSRMLDAYSHPGAVETFFIARKYLDDPTNPIPSPLNLFMILPGSALASNISASLRACGSARTARATISSPTLMSFASSLTSRPFALSASRNDGLAAAPSLSATFLLASTASLLDLPGMLSLLSYWCN